MKLLIAFLVFIGAAFAQNPNSCSQVQNAATSGQVLSAATSGRPPQCKWITGSGGGGSPAAPNSSLQFNDSSAFGGNSSFTVNKVTKGWTLNKLSCTGTPVTCTFYDDTATTGITGEVIRAGANQNPAMNAYTHKLTTWLDNSGAVTSFVDADGNFGTVDSAVNLKMNMGHNSSPFTAGMYFASDSCSYWSSNINLGLAPADVGLCRGASGQLNVTDGSATPTNLAALAAASIKTGSSAPSVTAGTGGVPFACAEGTAPSVGPAAGVDIVYCDPTAHKPMLSNNNGSYYALSQTIASGTLALATGAISSAACTTAQTATATGTVTTDVLTASFNGDPTAVTGYVPLTTGMLTIIVYPTADTFNAKVCNNTGSSITPGAITLNWRVSR